VYLDFYDAALCNLGFMICGSYKELVWPPLLYTKRSHQKAPQILRVVNKPKKHEKTAKECFDTVPSPRGGFGGLSPPND